MTLPAVQERAPLAEPRERIKALAAAMFAVPTVAEKAGDLVRLDTAAMTQHFFAPIEAPDAKHVYIRVMHLPKGATLMGMEHRTTNYFILVSGTLLLVDPDTGEGSRLDGFRVVLTQPGTQRTGHALEDVTMLNVFAVASDDVATAEAAVARVPVELLPEHMQPEQIT